MDEEMTDPGEEQQDPQSESQTDDEAPDAVPDDDATMISMDAPEDDETVVGMDAPDGGEPVAGEAALASPENPKTGKTSAFDRVLYFVKLAWRAMLFDEQAYAEVRDSQSPVLYGLVVLAGALAVYGIAAAIGQVLNFLMTPSQMVLWQTFIDILSNIPDVDLFLESPEFAEISRQISSTSAQQNIFGVMFGGIVGVGTVFVFGMISWVVYGLLTQLVARMLGGQAKLGPFMGTFALAYAPKMLLISSMLPINWPPTAVVDPRWITWWLLATGYLAVKSVHGLSWGRCLAAVIIPRVLIALVLWALIAMFVLLWLVIIRVLIGG